MSGYMNIWYVRFAYTHFFPIMFLIKANFMHKGVLGVLKFIGLSFIKQIVPRTYSAELLLSQKYGLLT